MKRAPNPMPGPSEVEIRRISNRRTFGEAMTPELAEQEDRLREQLSDHQPALGGAAVRRLAG